MSTLEKSARKPRVFILGVSGFLGFRLALHLRKNFSVAGGYFENQIQIPDCHFFPVHYRDYDSLESQIRALRPDFTIMAAGITSEREIIKNLKVAEAINALLPLSFALASQKNHSKNIHLSCSEVFEGHQGNYSESDRATSIDDIHRWKGEAETYVRAQTNENTILRFGRVLGLGHPYRLNRFDFWRKNFLSDKSIPVASHIKHSYMSAQSFCEAIEAILLEKFPAKNRVFHLGGITATEQEVVTQMCNEFRYNPKLIKTSEQERKEILDYSLNDELFRGAHPGWKKDKSLATIFSEIKAGMRPGMPLKTSPTNVQNP